MQTIILRSQFHPLRLTNLNPNSSPNSQTSVIPFKTQFPKSIKTTPTARPNAHKTREAQLQIYKEEEVERINEIMRKLVIGGASIGMMLFFMGIIDEQKATALGPEGPLMEEFWENVRRYGLYALTVSTGALYTILQPIVELFKNPISAVLIIIIFGGSFFIISQVLSAMVGVTDFSYDYGY